MFQYKQFLSSKLSTNHISFTSYLLWSFRWNANRILCVLLFATLVMLKSQFYGFISPQWMWIFGHMPPKDVCVCGENVWFLAPFHRYRSGWSEKRDTEIEKDLWFERLSGIKLVSIWAYSHLVTFWLPLKHTHTQTFYSVKVILSSFLFASHIFLLIFSFVRN